MGHPHSKGDQASGLALLHMGCTLHFIQKMLQISSKVGYTHFSLQYFVFNSFSFLPVKAPPKDFFCLYLFWLLREREIFRNWLKQLERCGKSTIGQKSGNSEELQLEYKDSLLTGFLLVQGRWVFVLLRSLINWIQFFFFFYNITTYCFLTIVKKCLPTYEA